MSYLWEPCLSITLKGTVHSKFSFSAQSYISCLGECCNAVSWSTKLHLTYPFTLDHIRQKRRNAAFGGTDDNKYITCLLTVGFTAGWVTVDMVGVLRGAGVGVYGLWISKQQWGGFHCTLTLYTVTHTVSVTRGIQNNYITMNETNNKEWK